MQASFIRLVLKEKKKILLYDQVIRVQADEEINRVIYSLYLHDVSNSSVALLALVSCGMCKVPGICHMIHHRKMMSRGGFARQLTS